MYMLYLFTYICVGVYCAYIASKNVVIGTSDYNVLGVTLLSQGLIHLIILQNEYYQGYLPIVLFNLLYMTGGVKYGNRVIKHRLNTNGILIAVCASNLYVGMYSHL